MPFYSVDAQTQSSSTVYHNESKGVYLEYPSDWILQENLSEVMPMMILKTDEAGTVYATIMLMHIAHSQHISPAQASELIITSLEIKENFTLDSQETAMMAGLPADKLMASFDEDSKDTTLEAISVMNKKTSFSLVMTSRTGENSTYSPIFQEIIDSVQIELNVIPEWIRNTAGWWATDQIGDGEFLAAIEYLLQNDIINIGPTEIVSNPSTENDIPIWIKNNASWWSQGVISDVEFLKAIEYLITSGIIAIV